MPPGVLSVNYMQYVNKVGRRIEKFPRRGYQWNWKIVNSLHQLAALQRFSLKLHADRWNSKISKDHTQIIKSILILHVVHDITS